MTTYLLIYSTLFRLLNKRFRNNITTSQIHPKIEFKFNKEFCASLLSKLPLCFAHLNISKKPYQLRGTWRTALILSLVLESLGHGQHGICKKMVAKQF